MNTMARDSPDSKGLHTYSHDTDGLQLIWKGLRTFSQDRWFSVQSHLIFKSCFDNTTFKLFSRLQLIRLAEFLFSCFCFFVEQSRFGNNLRSCGWEIKSLITCWGWIKHLNDDIRHVLCIISDNKQLIGLFSLVENHIVSPLPNIYSDGIKLGLLLFKASN